MPVLVLSDQSNVSQTTSPIYGEEYQLTEPTPKDPLNLKQYLKSPSELGRIKNKGLVEFYEKQNEFIDTVLDPINVGLEDEIHLKEYKIAMYGSFAANVFLFGLQLTAALLSGSLSLFATTADSFMDVTSNSVLLWTGRLASKENYMQYPTGKQKYKTAGIIVFATLMATLSVQLIVESGKTLTEGKHNLDLGLFSICLVAGAIGLKVLLFLYCRMYSHLPTVRILAQDHRNDVMFNSLGIIFGILASKYAWYIDPIGAIIIAGFIIRSWTGTALEHIKLIVGVSAEVQFHNQIVYMAMTHDDRIELVDTCRAYHSGNNCFVEVDVVFPPDMRLDLAHDIGESLQERLETLPQVDRAFVHLDYEITHKPEHFKTK
ncbi:putative cation efflux pump [Globomyces pollinis-pini]|nr:putative cation efflux pump [Globomyces pollinis-pini]